MPSKLAVPGKRFSPNDVETYVDDLNEAMQAVDDSVNAFNQQIDAAKTAENFSVLALNAIPIIQGYATRKSDFFALAAQSTISGFAQWGKSQPKNDKATVNEGMWAAYNSPNVIRMGRSFEDKEGVSVSDYPIASVKGVEHHINLLGRGCDPVYNNVVINFPPAPDGLDKSDGTGRFVDLAAAILAGGTSLSTSILSRQDFVFIESFHEKISDKDVVYPLGNVQYGVSTWESVPLSKTLVEQGYSAFGEWDSITHGYGITWSTLTDEQRTLFLQDHKNNIYSDKGELVQVRYRIRVIAGLGDSWQSVGVEATNTPVRYSPSKRVKPQGKQVSILGGDLSDYGYLSGERHYGWFVGKGSSERKHTTEKQGSIFGLYSALSTNSAGTSLGALDQNEFYGYNGECHLIPIALVQRRNSGGMDPSHNPYGTKKFRYSQSNPSFIATWSVLKTSGAGMTNTSQCFDLKNQVDAANSDFGASDYGGNIGTSSGRQDGKFYDEITASDVIADLRMSSRRVPKQELQEHYSRKAIDGEIRGAESVPFTVIGTHNYSSSNNKNYINIDAASYRGRVLAVGDYISMLDQTTSVWETRKITSTEGGQARFLDQGSIDMLEGQHIVCAFKQEFTQVNPYWAGIVGDIEKVKATFSKGVEGVWIPEILTSNIMLPRKYLRSNSTWRHLTQDDGNVWTIATSIVEAIANKAYALNNAGSVELLVYETKAHFTQDDITGITQLTDWASVYATNSHEEAFLSSSLVGEIATGTDPSEELAITKIVSDVISHTPEMLTPVVKYSTAIGVKEGVAYLLFNCDDTGIIDGSNIKAKQLPHFINEV
jgi:hypothetical protein